MKGWHENTLCYFAILCCGCVRAHMASDYRTESGFWEKSECGSMQISPSLSWPYLVCAVEQGGQEHFVNLNRIKGVKVAIFWFISQIIWIVHFSCHQPEEQTLMRLLSLHAICSHCCFTTTTIMPHSSLHRHRLLYFDQNQAPSLYSPKMAKLGEWRHM